MRSYLEDTVSVHGLLHTATEGNAIKSYLTVIDIFVILQWILGESSYMGRLIDGIQYYSATEVAKELGVSRQTIWRWRREAKIPPGNRFRDGQVMFTESELQAVREYSNRIEPLAAKNVNQLRLFNGAFQKKGVDSRRRRSS